MESKINLLIQFLERYTGKTTPLLLNREFEKVGIKDISNSEELKLLNLTDVITNDILKPILSKGRLPLARSELMGILGIGEWMAGIPTEIEGIRVLPENIEEESINHYKNVCEFILKQEMKKYGLKDMQVVDSKVRISILEAFVGHIFGPSGRSLINKKIDELDVRELNSAPFYNKLVLMEYVLQDMLLFCIKPIKAMLLRSELVSILDIDLEMAQGPLPEKIQKQVENARKISKVSSSNKLRWDYEDLISFLLKREISMAGIQDISKSSFEIKNRILASTLSAILGDMSWNVFSKLLSCDEQIKTKFYMKYFQNFLINLMPAKDVEIIIFRVKNMLSINFN